MASPQLEDGYTRIANELLEALYSSDLNGTQLKLVLCIWRFTYGFQRKEHGFSEAFISKAIHRHKNQVGPELQKLIERKIIKVEAEATFTRARVLAFNKNIKQWEQKEGQSVKSLTPSETTISTVSKLTDSTVSEFTGSTVSKFTDQEKKVFKESIKENNKDTICSEPEESAPSSSGINLPLNDNSCYDVPLSKIEFWKETYPAVDVRQELRRMIAWLDSNPTKQKTRKGVERFINNWLARTQDSGGSKGSQSNKRNSLEDWMNG